MKIRSIGAAAGIAALCIACFTGVLLLLFGVPFGVVAAVVACVLFASFFVAWVIMKKFIADKLRPIYRAVLSRELRADDVENEVMRQSRTLDDIEDELARLADINEHEIDRLKENEEFRKEFVENVAHEMKTPIFNIQGYIQTLLDGAMDDAEVNRFYLERAEKSVGRMINVLKDIDKLMRLESEDIHSLDLRRFDMVRLAVEVAEAMEMEAAKKGITIAVAGCGGGKACPVFVTADRRYIEQVLINLINNSIKYGVEGGRTCISFVELSDKVVVEVADNGIGIAPEHVDRIFDRFYRVDRNRSREQGGTGLGLTIVKYIVESHGGTIAVRSEPGAGSTFSFTLNKVAPSVPD